MNELHVFTLPVHEYEYFVPNGTGEVFDEGIVHVTTPDVRVPEFVELVYDISVGTGSEITKL